MALRQRPQSWKRRLCHQICCDQAWAFLSGGTLALLQPGLSDAQSAPQAWWDVALQSNTSANLANSGAGHVPVRRERRRADQIKPPAFGRPMTNLSGILVRARPRAGADPVSLALNPCLCACARAGDQAQIFRATVAPASAVISATS